jgi:adenylyltransferase/sulfurtransferase
MNREILPIELQDELASENPPIIIDVREPDELLISSLPGAINIPEGELPARLDELDPEKNYVILCRTGNRSGRATMVLKRKGFKHVRNIATGINGWAQTVDPTFKQY